MSIIPVTKQTLIKYRISEIEKRVVSNSYGPCHDNSRIPTNYANEQIAGTQAENARGGRIRGLIAEDFFFKMFKGYKCDDEGFDGYINGKKYEIKYTDSLTDEHAFKINRCNSNKKGKFDFMVIMEGQSGRMFSIPHDVWYERARFTDDDQFHWFQYYGEWKNHVNPRTSSRIVNTKLLLEYPLQNNKNIENKEDCYEMVLEYIYRQHEPAKTEVAGEKA